MRLGDDGELIEADERAKRKRKRKPLEISTLAVVGLAALLLLVGCLLILNLVNNRLRPAPIVAVPTFTPTLIPPTRSATPTLIPASPTPTATPTLVLTPPTIGIGEQPACAVQPITGEQRIVFATVYGDANRELYVQDLSNGAICRLTNDPAADTDPVWQVNGATVLFTHRESSSNNLRAGELWTVNLDGSEASPVPALSGSDAQWDVTGGWIVFVGAESGNLEVADSQGGQRRLLRIAAPDESVYAWDEFQPDCCALGALAQPRVVFAAAQRDGTRIGTSDGDAREIYLISVDGTDQLQLTDNDVYDDEPDWSPGGNQIVFTRGRYGFNTDIWIMNADGSNPIRLTDGEATDHSPRWLPDGRIMFVSERERAGAIYVMNADGSSLSPITHPLGVLTFDFWSLR